MSVDRAQLAALAARRDAGLGEDGPLPDVLRLIEQEGGVLIFALPLGRDNIAGLYERIRGVPFVLVNADHAPVRQRFTLAHEYGHHRLDHGARVDEHIDWNSRDPREREANEFAAALLMPEQAVSGWFSAHDQPDVDLETLVRLAAAFGVSAKAARVRLQRLKRLTSKARINALDAAIDVGEHSKLHDALGLGPYYDSVYANRGQARLPAPTEHKALTLLRHELLDPEVLARWMKLSPETVLARAKPEENTVEEPDA